MCYNNPIKFYRVVMGVIMSNRKLDIITHEMSADILESEIGTAETKKDVLKILHKANRRIQNIEKSGLSSPALKALYAEQGRKKGFTQFSIRGLDFSNPADWNAIKYTYGRAVSYLNNPTSSARGARAYINRQAKELGIDFKSANKLVDISTSPYINENGDIAIFKYKEILNSYKDAIMEVQEEDYANSQDYGAMIENLLEEELKKRLEQMTQKNPYYNVLDSFYDFFDSFDEE